MDDPVASLPDAGALSALRHRLERARVRRAPLAGGSATTAYRLVNAGGDGLPGLTVDRFGRVLVLSLYRELDPGSESAVVEAAASAFRAEAVYLKRRPREARLSATTDRDRLAPQDPAWGRPRPDIEALEDGVRYRIRPGGDLSVGLFLDMRDTRTWARAHSAGRTVLNAFAYTCGFSVCARLGGAAGALNLDLSRRVLDWGEENHGLNGLPVHHGDFVSGDAFDWLERLARRGEAFGMVVIDPPSFATWRGARFSVMAGYDRLAALAARVVQPGGLLVAACNHAGLSRRAFRAQVERGLSAAGRRYRVAGTLGASPLDFPVVTGEASPLKVLALEL